MPSSAPACRLWHERRRVAAAANTGAGENIFGWIGPVSRCARGIALQLMLPLTTCVRRPQLLDREREGCAKLLLGSRVKFGTANREIENIDGNLPFGIDQGHLDI